MTEPLEIQIRARAALGEAQASISKFLKEIEDGTGATGKKASISFGDIAKAATVVAGAITGLAAGIGLLGARGADVADLRGAFQQLNEAIGNDSVAVLDTLREAFAGTVTDANLMKAANAALGSGLRPTREEFGLLADAARVLADRYGMDATSAFTMFSEALATGRTRQLESKIGLIDNTKALESYAKQVGTTKDKLSEHEKIQAVAIATMEKLRETVATSGKAQVDFGDKVEQSKTKVANLVDAAGEWIAQQPAIGGFTSIATGLGGAFTAISLAAGPAMAAFTKLGPLVSGPVLGAFSSLGGVLTGTIIPLLTTAVPAAFAAITPFLLPAGLIIGGIVGIYEAWKHWDAIVAFFGGAWQTVVGHVSKMPDWLLAVTGPIGAVVLAFRHWDDITRIAGDVYTGVKHWIVDKFGDIVDSVRDKIRAVTGFFSSMYDEVVGHSIVPDMVDGVSLHFVRMEKNMGEAAARAKAKVIAHLAELAKVRDSLFGLDKIKDVTTTIEAIGGLAGVAKLDADAVKDLHNKLNDAMDAANKNGKDIPLAWQQIYLATQAATGSIADYVKAVGTIPEAYAQIPPPPPLALSIDYEMLQMQLAGLNIQPGVVTAAKKSGVDIGTTFTTGFKDSLANFPQLLTQAFTGGGGLLGAVKALGVQMADAIITPLMNGLGKLAQGAVTTGSALATALGGQVGGGVGATVAGLASGLGGAALAATAWGTSMAAAGVAGAVALSAATLGIGAAAIGVVALIKHFSGLSEAEREGRKTADDLREGLAQTLTVQQQHEVQTLVAQGNNRKWAETVIALRDAYIKAGHSAEEALAATDRLWRAEKEGGDAVKTVINEINDVLSTGTANAAATAQAALAAAAEDGKLHLDDLNTKIGDMQVRMGMPITIAVNTADAEAKLAMLAAQKAQLESIIGGNTSVDGSGNNSDGIMSMEEFIRRNGVEDAHRYHEAVEQDGDNGHVRGAAGGGLYQRPTFRILAESKPEIVGEPDAIAGALFDAMRRLQQGNSPAMRPAFGGGGEPPIIQIFLDGSELRQHTIKTVVRGLADGKIPISRRAITNLNICG